MGFVKSYGGLIAGRAILGMCEGGLIGGILVYLALFYRRQQLLTRIGLFACAAPLAIAFGGLLATGLSKISRGGYNGMSENERERVRSKYSLTLARRLAVDLLC